MFPVLKSFLIRHHSLSPEGTRKIVDIEEHKHIDTDKIP